MFIFNNWPSQKYTVFPVIIGVIGLSLVGGGLSFVLRENTENQVTSKALMLIETMNSVREYTSTQVKPELIERADSEFLPETIPAYSAREVFEGLRLKGRGYSDFSYREATLNPSNLRDKVEPFEVPIVQKFIERKGLGEQRGFYNNAAGDRLFYLARPIKITNSSCLQCHSTPDVAPKSVVEKYGSVNGMGWKLNDIVGAQIITVPAKKLIAQAKQSFLTIMTLVSIVFTLVLLSIIFVLNRHLLKPLRKTARVAKEVSMGYVDVEFQQTSNPDINRIIKAFERLKASWSISKDKIERVEVQE